MGPARIRAITETSSSLLIVCQLREEEPVWTSWGILAVQGSMVSRETFALALVILLETVRSSATRGASFLPTGAHLPFYELVRRREGVQVTSPQRRLARHLLSFLDQ